MSGGHAEFCPWASSPSPSSWSLPVIDLAEIVEAAAKMLSFTTDLPWIKQETMEVFQEGIDVVVAGLEKRKLGDNSDKKVKETAAILSILGWQKGSLEDTICDQFSVRRIGLWNFVSIQSELDRIEDLRVARELSGEVVDNDSPKKKEIEGKKYFDPMKEHLTWNPILVKDENSLAGWELVKESFKSNKRNESDNEVLERNSEFETSETTSLTTAQTVLGKVRALLEFW